MCLCDDFDSGDDVQPDQTRPLVIAYCGNHSQPWCTEVHVAASLESQGHKVIRLQEDAVSMRDIDAATWGADLFLWTRTEGFLKASAEDMVSWLASKRAIGLPTASLHLDLYAGIGRRTGGLETDPFWRTEYVFTPDGGSPEFFRRHNVNHFYLRPGVYDAECVVGTPRKEFEADVIFVGSGSPHGSYHPEWGYRRELLAFLVKTYGRRFVKHGGPPIHGGRSFIRGADLSDLYATARVVVGDTLCLGPEDQREPRFTHRAYWSDRVYETVGRGGYLVHPRIVGLEDEFTDGEHLRFYTYGDFDGLKAIIDAALADDAHRAQVKAAGMAMVKGACTYVHRTAEMIRILAEHSSAIAEAVA